MPIPKNQLSLDLSKFNDNLQSLQAKEINKLDNILSGLANYAYDTYDFIIELPENINDISSENAEKMVTELTELKKQVSPIMDILGEINYDSKYMDRAKETIGTIDDEIPALISLLKKKIK